METAQENDFDATMQLIEDFSFGFKPMHIKPLHHAPIVHKLSHQHLKIRFWEVEADREIQGAMTVEEIKKYPFPIVIHNFMEEHWAEV
jgi:A/G-specific adenine glycosylase